MLARTAFAVTPSPVHDIAIAISCICEGKCERGAAQPSEILGEVRLQPRLRVDRCPVVMKQLGIDLLQLPMCLLNVVKLLEPVVAALSEHLEIEIECSAETID